MLRSKAIWIFLLIGLIVLSGCQSRQPEQGELLDELVSPENANYKTSEARLGEYVKTSQGSATLYFPVTSDLSWDSDYARIQEVRVKAGDEVHKGDVLMVFQIEESQVNLEEQKLKLRRKNEGYLEEKERRYEKLRLAQEEVKGLSSYEYRIAQLKLEKEQVAYEQYVYQTEKEILELSKSIEEAENRTLRNQLTAPYDGVIQSVVPYHKGDKVEKGRTLISMYRGDLLLLKVSDVQNKLRYNMEVTIETGRKTDRLCLEGKVICAPNILPSTVSQDYAVIELVDSVATEKDFTASIQYTSRMMELRDVLLVDRKAIQRENGKVYVYILDGDMVQKRFIEEGFSNTDVIWVLNGLSEGQAVILD